MKKELIISTIIVAVLGIVGFAVWHFRFKDKNDSPGIGDDVVAKEDNVGLQAYKENGKPTTRYKKGEKIGTLINITDGKDNNGNLTDVRLVFVNGINGKSMKGYLKDIKKA